MNQKQFESILRVNHAGEYGAVYIYDMQYKVLKSKICLEMKKQ